MNCPKCFALSSDDRTFWPKCHTMLAANSHTPAPGQPSQPHPHPHPHPHPPQHEMHIAPLTERKNWGARILGGFLALCVVVGGAYAFLQWKEGRKEPVAAWPSPPRAVAGLPTGGLNHTCALTESGTILCWGNSELGQLADTIGAPAGVPCAVCTQGQFTHLDAGGNHTCARRTDGSVLLVFLQERT